MVFNSYFSHTHTYVGAVAHLVKPLTHMIPHKGNLET